MFGAMRVLVTGAAGMLGSALLRSLSKSSTWTVKGVTRKELDLENLIQVENLLRNFEPDAVIHAAAKVGGIQANISRPFDFLASNIQMDSNVISTCLRRNVQGLLYIGSSCMYPRDYRQPLVEADILKAPLEPTNEGYALAKIVGAKLCEYASSSQGVAYRTIIPSNLYGPGDNFNPHTSHLLASIIRKVHEAKERNAGEIEVWGSGNARREFTYVDDLASWVIGQLENLSDLPPVLNVGFGQDTTVNEFYKVALETLNVNASLSHDTSKPEGVASKLMDSRLARDNFAWLPQTSLATGIRKTYDWFLQNEKTL